MTSPDPSNVLDLIDAFRRSKTMVAAVSLGVFDALVAGPKSLAELADELRSNRDGGQRANLGRIRGTAQAGGFLHGCLKQNAESPRCSVGDEVRIDRRGNPQG